MRRRCLSWRFPRRQRQRCKTTLESISGQEVIVTRNGKEVGRFIPKDAAVSYLTDSLTGILKKDAELDEAKAERLKGKYEIAD